MIEFGETEDFEAKCADSPFDKLLMQKCEWDELGFGPQKYVVRAMSDTEASSWVLLSRDDLIRARDWLSTVIAETAP